MFVKHLIPSIILTVFFLTTATADTIRLKTGEVLIGDIKSADLELIQARIEFPRQQELTLRPSDLKPESYYEIVSARTIKTDASARMALARFCIESGLYSHAAVEAKIAARIDPGFAKEAEEIRKLAVQSIARGLLEDAKTYAAVDEPEMAALYLRAVLQRYPQTESARAAKRFLAKLPKSTSRSDRELITDKEKKDELRKFLERGSDLLKKATKASSNLTRHFRSGSDERLLRRIEPYYRTAYKTLKRAANKPTDDSTLNKQIHGKFVEARSQLTRIYLELGTLSLARGALKTAEDYCSLACQVEPERKELHELHQKITDAKIAIRFGGY